MRAWNRFHWTVFVCLLVTPVLILVAIQSETNTQDVHTWLPNGTPERDEYDRFLTLFGHDDDILLSWLGCDIFDPRLEELTQRLKKQNEVEKRYRGVVNGAIVLEELIKNRTGLSPDRAREKLSSVFIGTNGETTGIVLQLSEKGRADRKATLKSLFDEVEKVPGLKLKDLRLGGNSYVNAEIDRATNQSLLLSMPAVFICIVITWICLRSWRLTVITLFVAGLAALASIAMVTGLGYKINGLLVLMPVLVLVLTLSGCIHLCSYYRTLFVEQAGGEANDLARKTLALGWRPSSMAMLTTSIGIMMLSTSHIEAVRHFGWFSALSLVVALGVLLLIFPALLAIWPAPERERRKWLERIPTISVVRDEIRAARPIRWAASILLLLVLVVGPFMAWGLGELKTTLSPTKMFPKNSGVNRGYDWISKKWTALETIEMVVRFPKEEGILVDQMQIVKYLQRAPLSVKGVTSTYSVASLSPVVPRNGGSHRRSLRAIAQRRAANELLEDHHKDLMDQQLIAEDDEFRYWKIHIGTSVASDDDCEKLLADIQAKSELAVHQVKLPVRVTLTGLWPLSVAGRQQLFDDLAFSFLMAFAIITPVVMLVLRGVFVGLVAMIPNVFPALMFFGGLSWINVPIDIGTILTASVGMGIAVDDTLHFIEWYSREQKTTGCRMKAVRATIRQCARPMFYTTLICSAGLSLFVFSHFIPPRQFAYAIVALLSLALICDLILLPALIVGPLGFVFNRKAKVG